MVDLGRLGSNMVLRLMRGGHQCVVYDRDADLVAALVEKGATGATDIEDFASKLVPPRTAWLMMPAGATTGQAICEISTHFIQGDTIVDGSNSYYKDDVLRAELLGEKGIYYLDVGASCGAPGLGYCLMIGGDKTPIARLNPIFRTLTQDISNASIDSNIHDSRSEQGYLHCGPAGAGHFVKMLHNGIEYGLMQACTDVIDILRNAKSLALQEGYQYDFNPLDIARLWQRDSTVSSWLLALTSAALIESKSHSFQTFSSQS